MDFKKLVFNFIPIFLLFALLSYTEKFIHISGSVLGRLFAVFIIIFYTSIDKIHGILAAALVVLYYQSDIVESMLNIYESEMTYQTVSAPTLLATDKTLSYLSQYEKPMIINTDCGSKETFRKEYCKKGHLVKKGQNVPIDMTRLVYPEVTYVNDNCNICDSTCDFSVATNMIDTGSTEGFTCKSCRK